jgi:hypothetical protein
MHNVFNWRLPFAADFALLCGFVGDAQTIQPSLENNGARIGATVAVF